MIAFCSFLNLKAYVYIKLVCISVDSVCIALFYFYLDFVRVSVKFVIITK